jgi:hypothetical protein
MENPRLFLLPSCAFDRVRGIAGDDVILFQEGEKLPQGRQPVS